MAISVVLSRPNHDDTTAYLHEWSKEIIDYAENKGVKIAELPGNKATRKNLLSYLEQLNPTHVFINGHGAEDCVCGHNNEPILSTKDCKLAESKTLYIRSCRTGVLLGPMLVKEGKAKAFIGYKRDFIFPFDSRRTATPLKDDVSKPIFECSNKVMFSLIKGNSASEANEKSQETYVESIRHYINDKSIEAPHIIRCLLWNQANQICIEN